MLRVIGCKGRNACRVKKDLKRDTERLMMANQSLLTELWEFLKVRKRYWLLPIIIVLLFLGLLIFFTESSTVAPFIYALF